MKVTLTQKEVAATITSYMAFKGYSIDRDIEITRNSKGITAHLTGVTPVTVDTSLLAKMISEGKI